MTSVLRQPTQFEDGTQLPFKCLFLVVLFLKVVVFFPPVVVPVQYWPLLKATKSGLAGSKGMTLHGNVESVPGGVALDGESAFLDAGDFHGKCISDPSKCSKGFAVAAQVCLIIDFDRDVWLRDIPNVESNSKLIKGVL